MADTKYAFFTFSLPEDTGSNKIKLFSSSTETGTYSQVGSDIDYSYGDTSYEFNAIDETKWYKIQFYNSSTLKLGPLSDAVYGGNFSTGATPALFVSTSTDGSNYATTQEVLDYGTLTTTDFSSSLISKCLRRARALIDYRTAEMGIDRYTDMFETEVARRKYNASLRIIKEAEICFTLAMAYRAKADDTIMANINSGEGTIDTLSIGATTISTDTGGNSTKNYFYLTDLSAKYANSGSALLAMLAPSSVFLSYNDNVRPAWFPFGWKNIY
jgi:hypothetical protein